MGATDEAALARVIAAASLPGLRTGHRFVAPDDDTALLADEARTIATRVPQVRRANGAGRIVARRLLSELGFAPAPLPKSASGAPLWPAGAVGSISHDACVAVAAVARMSDFAAIGIDIEPAQPLPADTLGVVATPAERARLDRDPLEGLVLFCVKEAVYKATHPLDGEFLEYGDIAVDLAAGTARVRNGRVLNVRVGTGSHIVAIAAA